jgi:hypothetical protein
LSLPLRELLSIFWQKVTQFWSINDIRFIYILWLQELPDRALSGSEKCRLECNLSYA